MNNPKYSQLLTVLDINN